MAAQQIYLLPLNWRGRVTLVYDIFSGKKGETMSRPAGTYAIFETTQGNIVVKLFEKEAPKTVENFIGLAMPR